MQLLRACCYHLFALACHNSHLLRLAQVWLSPQSVEGETGGLWTLWINMAYLLSSASSFVLLVDPKTLLQRSGFYFRIQELAVISCFDCFFSFSPSQVLYVTKRSLLFPSIGSSSSRSSLRTECRPLGLWSVTMVFVSSISNAIITLNSYRVREITWKLSSHSLIRTRIWKPVSFWNRNQQLQEWLARLRHTTPCSRSSAPDVQLSHWVFMYCLWSSVSEALIYCCR